MDGITRRQLVLDADFIAETENEVELGTSVWMLPHSIDDTDITYNGKPLSTLHEENKAAQSRTILTNTSPLDMNSQVFSPTARRSSSLLRLEESAERWIRILALREHYSRKKFTTVRGSEQTDNSSSTQNSQISSHSSLILMGEQLEIQAHNKVVLDQAAPESRQCSAWEQEEAGKVE